MLSPYGIKGSVRGSGFGPVRIGEREGAVVGAMRLSYRPPHIEGPIKELDVHIDVAHVVWWLMVWVGDELVQLCPLLCPLCNGG